MGGVGVSKDTLNPSVTNPLFPTAKETNAIQQMEASKGSWPRGVLTQVHFHSTNFFPPLMEYGLRNLTASYLRKGSRSYVRTGLSSSGKSQLYL